MGTTLPIWESPQFVHLQYDPHNLQRRQDRAYLSLCYSCLKQERFAAMGQTPDQVAQVIVAAAATENPDFRYTTSPMMQGFAAQKYVDTTGNGLVAYFEKQLGKE